MFSRNQYTFAYNIYLICCFIRTRLFYKNARLIRFPFDIRNRRSIIIGKAFTTGPGCRLEAGFGVTSEPKLTIGDNVQINDYVHITAWKRVKIGNNVLMASKIYISDVSHGTFKSDIKYNINIPPLLQPLVTNPVSIGDNTWIGESVSILPGTHIGKYCVIGANSLVNKNIPDYSIAVGNPIRIVKRYCFESQTWHKID